MSRLRQWRQWRQIDEKTDSLDEALAMIEKWTATGEAKSVALLGKAADVFPELFKRRIRPDIVTDQISACERIVFQGLPARIAWIGLGDRHRASLAFKEIVANAELIAPIVIGRDHLASGSVAFPTAKPGR